MRSTFDLKTYEIGLGGWLAAAVACIVIWAAWCAIPSVALDRAMLTLPATCNGAAAHAAAENSAGGTTVESRACSAWHGGERLALVVTQYFELAPPLWDDVLMYCGGIALLTSFVLVASDNDWAPAATFSASLIILAAAILGGSVVFSVPIY